MPREEQNSSEAHLTVKKLFVAGLREGIDEESLRQHFSRFGNIMEVLVMKDRDGKFVEGDLLKRVFFSIIQENLVVLHLLHSMITMQWIKLFWKNHTLSMAEIWM